MKAWKYLIGAGIIAVCGIMNYMGNRTNEQQLQAFAALAHVAESEENLDAFIASMTTEEKIGQMIQVDRNFLRYREIIKYKLGSVLSGGGSAPATNTPGGWVDMVDSFQQDALSNRLAIPLLYGIDAVHGHNTALSATVFPHNIGLGAVRDPVLTEKIGAATAAEVTATGIRWTFAPCVAVVRDIRWGRGYESFGETPELQELLAGSYVRGFQGDAKDANLGQGKILATAKHFFGDGGAQFGTGRSGGIDQGDIPELTEEELKNIHLTGYKKAIEQNVATIMVSFSGWHGIKMHESKHFITDLLKGEMKFQGFVISDYEGIDQVTGSNYNEKIVAAVNAGIDMIMTTKCSETFGALQQGIQNSSIPIERIDDAVKRILKVKIRAGLFEKPYADKSAVAEFSTQPHKDLAREAVRKSLVLLKNNNAVLPFKKNQKIFVTGPLMDSVGGQCGGWTMTWQGKPNGVGWGTSVLNAFKAKAALNDSEIITNPADAKQADVAVVVIGEKPYAEFEGDNSDLGLSSNTAMPGNNTALDNVKDLGIPVVVIMISGRPLIVADRIAQWDAFVAAWLPGTEGGGVADVLFGDYNFTGKLPVSWPKSTSQLPLNVGQPVYDPLFPYGFGLTY
jgi:beta-glucosidase